MTCGQGDGIVERGSRTCPQPREKSACAGGVVDRDDESRAGPGPAIGDVEIAVAAGGHSHRVHKGDALANPAAGKDGAVASQRID